MDFQKQAIALHRRHHGKIQLASRVPLRTRQDLSLAYTPGVAAVSQAIAQDNSQVWSLTSKANTVAVITDGTAVLGLGNVGPAAALPVMEGKCLLFKRFADVDAWPICLATTDTEEIILTVSNLAPGFGGINLEDIAAPRCFEIEQRLDRELDIPVFHDDQHGAAMVVLAGLTNALKVVGKEKQDKDEVKIVVSGAGAAGTATAQLLVAAGFSQVIVVDSQGALVRGRSGMNQAKQDLAGKTNPHREWGNLRQVMEHADVFIGLSAPGIVNQAMVTGMADQPIVFALANPTPEIMPDKAKQAGAAVVATGRSDFPNQLNNALVFPGLFRGLLTKRRKQVPTKTKLRVARKLAALVKNPKPNKIIPNIFEPAVARTVAAAV